MEWILYDNQINARALIGQSAMVDCASKTTRKNRSSSELYNAARDLWILFVFYKHPWFISL